MKLTPISGIAGASMLPSMPTLHNHVELQTRSILTGPTKLSFDINESEPQATYTRSEIEGRLRIRSGMDDILRRMAEKLITKQYSEGNHFYQLMYGGAAIDIDPTLRIHGKQPSAEELELAESMVGDNGEYGVKNASTQILNSVKVVAGGDPAKIERYRDSMQQAFENVSDMFGGEPAQIIKDTYKAVMAGFDQMKTDAVAAKTPAPDSQVHSDSNNVESFA